MQSPSIRLARADDAAAINRIYNHYVRHSTVTFDIEPWDEQRRREWLGEFAEPHCALVAELNGEIAGFAFNHFFRAKAAYRRSTETTVYAAPGHQSRGLGAALYGELFARIAGAGLHRAYAVIALPNPRSVALHRRFGFTRLATLREVGYKFDRYIDVDWYEKALA